MSRKTQRFQPELYRNYVDVLARVGLRNLGQLQPKLDASDLVQEAMLQAHVALPQFQGATDNEFVAWLREILENKLVDAIRHYGRKKRDVKLEQALCRKLEQASSSFEVLECKLAANGTTPSQYVLQNQTALILAESLALLPKDQRTALELHHLEDHSLEETAGVMNRTPASVAGLLRRGLETLRENLKAKEEHLR
jgi:RNA polymerase sigma-70 factor (ECF subfamily)